MSNIALTIENLKKSEANAIVKAMNKLVELGQIKESPWTMTDVNTGLEVDAKHHREAKKQAYSAFTTQMIEQPEKLTQEMVRKALKDFPL